LTHDGTDFDWAAAGGGGITEADQWRLTASLSLDAAAAITANWERDDQGSFDLLGTGMSESSGVFTFPSTGFWLIQGTSSHYKTGGYDYLTKKLYTTVDNSNYSTANASTQGGSTSNAGYASSSFNHIFDVESTANCKCRLNIEVSTTGMGIMGDSNFGWTWFRRYIKWILKQGDLTT
jgi:hypothetical protein